MQNRVIHFVLVVATRGRSDALRRLFESLTRQTVKSFTVLLGDQNDKEYLKPLLKDFKGQLFIQRIMLKPQSLSQARNVLLPYVVGADLVAFTDDDCHYAPDCFEKVVEEFAKNPTIGGIIANPNGRISCSEKSVSVFSALWNAPSWTLFFKYSAVSQIGSFDETLGIGSPGPYQSGEETDFLIRGIRSGVVVKRSTSPVVFHDEVEESSKELLLKTHGYALGRMRVLKKHNFPLWFKFGNVFYPLLSMPITPISLWRYRMMMFWGRLQGLLFNYNRTWKNN